MLTAIHMPEIAERRSDEATKHEGRTAEHHQEDVRYWR
jgi:hypothetical protein